MRFFLSLDHVVSTEVALLLEGAFGFRFESLDADGPWRALGGTFRPRVHLKTLEDLVKFVERWGAVEVRDGVLILREV